MKLNTDWVVYLMTIKGGQPGRLAVCTAGEWGALEAGRPGYHTLVRRVVGSEGEAEACARGLQPAPDSPQKKQPATVARLPDRLPMGHGCGKGT